jgi:hypothetical protein
MFCLQEWPVKDTLLPPTQCYFPYIYISSDSRIVDVVYTLKRKPIISEGRPEELKALLRNEIWHLLNVKAKKMV